MTERDRLVQLLMQRLGMDNETTKVFNLGEVKDLADYLIAHGVAVLTCKPGDLVYNDNGELMVVNSVSVYMEGKSTFSATYHKGGCSITTTYPLDAIGRTVVRSAHGVGGDLNEKNI